MTKEGLGDIPLVSRLAPSYFRMIVVLSSRHRVMRATALSNPQLYRAEWPASSHRALFHTVYHYIVSKIDTLAFPAAVLRDHAAMTLDLYNLMSSV